MSLGTGLGMGRLGARARLCAALAWLALSCGAAGQSVEPGRGPRPGPVQPGQRPMAPGAQRPAANPLAGLDYVSLVVRDAEGKLQPLDTHLSIAALRHTPSIGQAEADKLLPMLAAWQDDYDRMVRDLVDVAARIDAGLLGTIDLHDENDAVLANEVMKYSMLQPGVMQAVSPQLAASAGKQPVLTQQQWDVANAIGAEYLNAARMDRAQAIERAHGAQSQTAILEAGKAMVDELSYSLQWSYQRQVRELEPSLPGLVEGLGWDEARVRQWREAIAAARATDIPGAAVEATRQLMRDLPYESQRQILNASAERRAREVPELERRYPHLHAIRNKPTKPGS